MGNLFFPQLTSGALAQYPIRKTRIARTIKNVLPDGRMILLPDPNATRLTWQLSYAELSFTDMAAIQAHFSACVGPFHAFTFIDPTDNMLVWSSDLTQAPWQISSQIKMTGGMPDPTGGTAAFTVTNLGEATQEISQTLSIPASYQYAFSLYAASAQPSTLMLIRSGATAQESTVLSLESSWSRLISAGQLNDSGTSFRVAISLQPGQQVQLYGVQLEAQLTPSRYRPTAQAGGVYRNAHWAADELVIAAEAPNLFSTTFTIEAYL